MEDRDVYTSDHEAFRREVRRFIETEIVPFHYEWEDQGHFPRELWKQVWSNNPNVILSPLEGVVDGDSVSVLPDERDLLALRLLLLLRERRLGRIEFLLQPRCAQGCWKPSRRKVSTALRLSTSKRMMPAPLCTGSWCSSSISSFSFV